MQEIYQLKKKIKIVEEELLSSNSEPYYDQQQKQTTGSLMNEVTWHYENGYSIERISQLTGLTETEVQSLLANYLRKEWNEGISCPKKDYVVLQPVYLLQQAC